MAGRAQLLKLCLECMPKQQPLSHLCLLSRLSSPMHDAACPKRPSPDRARTAAEPFTESAAYVQDINEMIVEASVRIPRHLSCHTVPCGGSLLCYVATSTT